MVYVGQIGDMIDASQVEQAVEDTIRLWATTYLAELERQRGLPARTLKPPRDYLKLNEFDPSNPITLPACVIVSPGMTEPPVKGGQGKYTATWGIVVGIIVSANTQENTMILAKRYCAALRTMLLQQKSLGGFASGNRFLEEGYDEIPSSETDTMVAATLGFEISVDDVSTASRGLSVPPADPYAAPSPAAVITTHKITTTKKEDTP